MLAYELTVIHVTHSEAYLFGKSEEIFIERSVEGKPHSGKVLAVVAPHADDFTIFCGGTVAKLVREGYTAYFIRTSNDEKDSYDYDIPETILHNAADHRAAAKILGVKKCFDLDYRNHRMDEVSPTELRARLVYLFRLLKVDTVITFDPCILYEENPDHYVTAKAVEAAAWMAGCRLDYPEHFEGGLKPHAVKERYYFARGPQLVNRVVDISSTIDVKLAAIKANRTQVTNMALRLRDYLAERNLRLPELEKDIDSVIDWYVETVFRSEAASIGKRYGLEYAEAFHYVGPFKRKHLQRYVEEHSVPLKKV